ncbi:Hypothetical protein SMAX5B_004136 [Scophthalmus maximus]|uniref:Uncharacterized protein n=1 Tax=Scophthalmus maximus TaxID=52904 RepID=A0A2U9B7R9_SCOMX|nr:Hypothetical protein SMAX5B_004136 [Scophthalmus maximus]
MTRMQASSCMAVCPPAPASSFLLTQKKRNVLTEETDPDGLLKRPFVLVDVPPSP